MTFYNFLSPPKKVFFSFVCVCLFFISLLFDFKRVLKQQLPHAHHHIRTSAAAPRIIAVIIVVQTMGALGDKQSQLSTVHDFLVSAQVHDL